MLKVDLSKDEFFVRTSFTYITRITLEVIFIILLQVFVDRFGFIKFESVKSAEQAHDLIANGLEINGKKIKANYALNSGKLNFVFILYHTFIT